MTSWEGIAHTLAARLMHSAYQCPERHHPPAAGCPFCADTIAYQEYRAKCRETGRVPMAISDVGNVPLVPLHDVLSQGRKQP